MLLANQPENMHLVLVTREDPLLPLARLRANNQMADVDPRQAERRSLHRRNRARRLGRPAGEAVRRQPVPRPPRRRAALVPLPSSVCRPAGQPAAAVAAGSGDLRAAWPRQRVVGAGCRPGDLRLVILTHGDFDHAGNAAYLRDRFSATIAMHRGDSGMAQRGDGFSNRRKGNVLQRLHRRPHRRQRALLRRPADEHDPAGHALPDRRPAGRAGQHREVEGTAHPYRLPRAWQAVCLGTARTKPPLSTARSV